MRRLAVAILALLPLAGCGSATVAELPPAAGPADAPPPTTAPAGRVVAAADAPRIEPDPSAARVGDDVAVVRGRARVLQLVDSRTHAVVDQAPAGVGPTHVAAYGDRLYVTDTRGGAVLIYHVAPRLTLTRRVNLPGAPYAIAPDPRRRRLWVTLSARNELVGLTADRTAPEVARLPTLRRPDAVDVDSGSGTIVVRGRPRGVAQVVSAQQADAEDRG